MGLDYRNLDGDTRLQMVGEIDRDIADGVLYYSPRLTEQGVREWPALLLGAAKSGTDDTLAQELTNRGLLNTHEESRRNGKVFLKRVPVTAPQTLAEGEFNRMYLRAVASRGILEGRAVQVYRGRASASPRTESEALVGHSFDPRSLLNDLRAHVGVDVALGLPPGPNSGLTGELS